VISNGHEYPYSIRENFLSFINNPIYPEGYEGKMIREVAPSPGVSDIPNLYIQNILNNKVTFYDSNFFTFDNVSFTCDSGGVPVIYYELYKLDSLDEVLVLEGYNSASNLYEYDAGSSDIERNYRIKAWYYCGDDDLYFTEKASLEFTITPQGTQKYDIWDNCLTDTFPYFNMDSCWSATMSVYELLFTGKILFPNWTFDATCHSMNTLDDWLGLQSGYVLCPQFPANIRNTVTPFIAFLLGIVTIGMIKRRTGS